jgi:hypothetical protein
MVPKGPARGGYTYATASANDAFHTITAYRGGHFESYHGYLIRDGEWSKLASGRREVLRARPCDWLSDPRALYRA